MIILLNMEFSLNRILYNSIWIIIVDLYILYFELDIFNFTIKYYIEI